MSMQAIVSVLSRLQPNQWTLLLGLALSSCQSHALPPQRVINIQQQWELEPGDLIADQLVVGSLGDISIQLKRQPLRAPFTGKVEPSTIDQCIIYSTPEVPAYLFRFCGLHQPHLGPVQAGQSIGRGRYIQFATLRRQPDGTWIIVEPSTGILERSLSDRHYIEKPEAEEIDQTQNKSPQKTITETSSP
ncbi:hypothetical protein [Leptothoe spongobia]|uniref:Uncharacterized protein n=1 Tax=Leptothoe spongobia TAU-MAC 1115 TaxID=1967444 RepID=A0A947GKP3_9CYAN|nr:hypothetical protein [Leptothoe spongobia]MBT9317038.1 hypothetical protein [Leptothoe spongobia TAU-MAC 1115]